MITSLDNEEKNNIVFAKQIFLSTSKIYHNCCLHPTSCCDNDKSISNFRLVIKTTSAGASDTALHYFNYLQVKDNVLNHHDNLSLEVKNLAFADTSKILQLR